MAHEIESIFYVGETPWHGLGHKVVEAPSTREAIVMAGLDWRVRTEPVFLKDGRAGQYRELARRQINADDLARYVIKVAGHGDKKFEDLASVTQARVESMFERFVHGHGHEVVGVAGTWWAAYNAVTEEMAHNTRAGGDAKYQSLWFGDNARRNRLALETAIEMAEVAA